MALTKTLGGGGGSGTLTTVKDEGVNLSTAVTSIDFVGSGVTATGTTAVTVTIPGGTPAEVRIDRQTPSGTGTVTFSSVAGYSDLRVVVVGRGSAAAANVSVLVRLNNDSTAIYDYERLEYANATNFSAGSVAQTSWQIGYVNASTAPSGVASAAEARIYDYAGTTLHKTMMATSGVKATTGTPGAGDCFADRFTGWYRSTSAITRVDVILSSGNFSTGSVVSIYGIL